MQRPNPGSWRARWLQLCLLYFLWNAACHLTAQESPVLVTNPPAHGTFYLMYGIPPVPYPFDPYYGTLPVYAYNGVLYVDNRPVEVFVEGEGGGMMLLAAPPPPGIGGTNSVTNLCCNSLTNFTVDYLYSTNGLALGIAQTTNPWIALTVQTTTTNASYDVFGTTNMADLALPSLSRTNWTWLVRANASATNFSWGQTNWCERYFQLGTMQDSDNDGLTDAYEQVVSHTGTNVPNSPRDIYEGISSSQNPSAWFKLNDASLVDAQGGSSLTNGGGVWDVDAFAIGNGAFSFQDQTDRLTAGDVISGGTGTNQGFVSLLFRSLTGPPTSKRYLFSQKGASSSQEFAVFVESNGAPVDPAGLKVQIGGQTVTMSTGIVYEAWYYLAMMWHETNDVATWYLAPIGGTLTNGTINLTNSAVVGSSSNLYVGNRQNNNGTFSSAFRSPGNGALDQIAFWNRELTDTEVNAQFNTLEALFHGPSKVFDLTRWNLLLPVDKTNGLNTNNLALEISTGWLNSGFKYVDPTDWTQQYFYLSTNNTMVFEAPWNGARSTSGSGARSELRGTLADGNEDNWTLAGTNTLEATCAVHIAGTNGTSKVIIGQIHGKSPDVATFTLSYNFPNPKDVSVSYKTNAAGSGVDGKLILATNVNLLDLIQYKMQLSDDGTTVKIRGEVFGTNSLGQQEQTLTLDPSNSWHSSTFYFKAGCYYPNYPSNGTAKVIFSSLSGRHGP